MHYLLTSSQLRFSVYGIHQGLLRCPKWAKDTNSQIIQDKAEVTNKQPIIIMLNTNKIIINCQVFPWSGEDGRVVTVVNIDEVVVGQAFT